jgi:hypothetical protein
MSQITLSLDYCNLANVQFQGLLANKGKAAKDKSAPPTPAPAPDAK